MKHSIKKSLAVLLISIQSIGYTHSAHFSMNRPSLNGNLSPSQELIQAAASGRLTRVHELLRAPTINLEATNSMGSTALLAAAEAGYTEIVRMLCTALTSQQKQNIITATFMLCARRCTHVALETFLNAGIDINTQDEQGTTALMLIISAGIIETVILRTFDMVINAGANIHLTTQYDATALTIACNNPRPEIVKRLIALEADVNTYAHALRNAIYKNYPEIVTLLLNAGAPINHQNEQGETPLIIAVKENRIDIVKILLEASADVHRYDTKNQTAMDIAQKHGRTLLINLLDEYYPMVKPASNPFEN